MEKTGFQLLVSKPFQVVTASVLARTLRIWREMENCTDETCRTGYQYLKLCNTSFKKIHETQQQQQDPNLRATHERLYKQHQAYQEQLKTLPIQVKPDTQDDIQKMKEQLNFQEYLNEQLGTEMPETIDPFEAQLAICRETEETTKMLDEYSQYYTQAITRVRKAIDNERELQQRFQQIQHLARLNRKQEPVAPDSHLIAETLKLEQQNRCYRDKLKVFSQVYYTTRNKTHESMDQLFERLLAAALCDDPTTYITPLPGKQWPKYIEMLFQSGVIACHPDDRKKIRLEFLDDKRVFVDDS